MSLDPLTVVFALVAIFVIWKLKSVLGERTGLEKQRDGFFGRRTSQANGGNGPGPATTDGSNIVRLPGAPSVFPPRDRDRWNAFAAPGSPLAAGLDSIAGADPSFSPVPFLDGAKTAYEAIVTAFAAGERTTLRNLLARDVFDGFASAIGTREQRNETLTTTVVAIDEAQFVAASLEGRAARVTVRFLSRQISATHDREGKIVEGGTDRSVEMNDLWTFSRDVTSRDPNWKLVATESGR